MGSTYYSLHYHWVCSTKERRPFIKAPWREPFYKYLGGTVRGLQGTPVMIGGVSDYVHVLLGLKPTHCISDLVRELKKAASVWASAHQERQFEWQEGYSVFTVSASKVETVCRYIQAQEMHHSCRTFEEELKELLAKHQIHYDPRYLL